jgi:hypothetical protein
MRDPETLCRHFGLEHIPDVALVLEPTLEPTMPTRRVADQQGVYRWGITLGRPPEVGETSTILAGSS